MSNPNPWYDPRLTVFIIWGTFILIFICVPCKQSLYKLLHRIGCPCCSHVEEEVDQNENGGGVLYEALSSARKREIDSFRASHITYRLHPFSLTLEKKHMSRCASATETPFTMSIENNDTSLPQDKRPDTSDEIPQNSDAIDHVADDAETGLFRGMDPSHQEESENVEYTHIMIPLPGYNFECVDMFGCDKVDKEPRGKEEKKSRIRLFRGRDKMKGVNEDSKITTGVEEKITVKGEMRSCSIFCAICLAEYAPAERVSWSSNPDCTHVFHADCIVEWLVSLGRTKSKNVRFSTNPNEAQLLKYQLACPCCRQAFILAEKERRGLRNV
ncbi:hypothetical protein ACHAXA_010980 [Cyclostephanos tholiformis]|uniref:RING-type domain-containing protein n=1 Tax=Cyclostephanos tholiformis TaxID=382380 RepID=A0ABD3RR03_9STRA